eukprot:CAMPEP_0119261960 /NCGR_PEP_ID=MMETSP1329-20130426/1845_1 /TAXON_ID=114041 /ORGANISM="Genus nov. species nov., Strain RCC1024" /LENGTH=149 /DNA_ID=CAMNT_0007261567 /DNA_START=188 /DNA_END=637 /DNA_ORIENTATION=+
MFNTSKLVRRNTTAAVEQASRAAEDDAVAHTVVGNVTKGECQLINRVLLASTSLAGNLNAVPHSCTIAEEGAAPVPHRASYMFGFLARRSTKNPHAVQWPEGTISQHAEEHVTGGEISQGECARLAKHLSETFGTVGLIPKACRSVLDM